MTSPDPRAPRDQESWARPVDRLTTTATDHRPGHRDRPARLGPRPGLRPDVAEDVRRPGPGGRALARRPSSPTGRTRFPTFWPKGSTFYAPLAGITPGRGRPARGPARPRLARSRCPPACMVIYADRESFTFMTPEGHALPAWITFSAYRDGDETVAQVAGPGAHRATRSSSSPTCSARTAPTTASGSRRSRTSHARSASSRPDRRDDQGVRRQAAPVEVRGQRPPQRRRSTWPSARSPPRPAGSAAGGRRAEGERPDRAMP